MSYAALALAIAATSGAQILFKMYFLHRRLPLVMAAVGMFCMVPALNYLALKELPLSTVYMATGLTYVLVVGLASGLLRERISRRTAHAMVLIVAGTVLFNL